MSTDNLSVRSLRADPTTVLAISGTLDSTTYLAVRDAIVAAAVDTAGPLVVDVRTLSVPARSAWSVITSAAFMIRRWPGVPLAVVADAQQCRQLSDTAVTRSVPAFSELDTALDHLDGHVETVVTHRLRTTISRNESAVATARVLVAHEVEEWNAKYAKLALVVTTVLVSNVVAHTDSDPDLRVEVHGDDRLVLAVGDRSPRPPMRTEDRHGRIPVASGLALLSALTMQWSYTPTGDGKTVWAVIGPDEVAQFAAC